MEVMRPDVVSHQTIQGSVGMEIHTVIIVRYESCDVPGDQDRFHGTLTGMRKVCKVDVSCKLTEYCDEHTYTCIPSAITYVRELSDVS